VRRVTTSASLRPAPIAADVDDEMAATAGSTTKLPTHSILRQPASIRSAVISKKLLMTYFNAKSDHILSTAQFTTPTTTNLQETRLPNLTSIT